MYKLLLNFYIELYRLIDYTSACKRDVLHVVDRKKLSSFSVLIKVPFLFCLNTNDKNHLLVRLSLFMKLFFKYYLKIKKERGYEWLITGEMLQEYVFDPVLKTIDISELTETQFHQLQLWLLSCFTEIVGSSGRSVTVTLKPDYSLDNAGPVIDYVTMSAYYF